MNGIGRRQRCQNAGHHIAAATFLAAAGRRFGAKVAHQQIHPQGVAHFSIVDVEIQQETAVVAHFTGVRGGIILIDLFQVPGVCGAAPNSLGSPGKTFGEIRGPAASARSSAVDGRPDRNPLPISPGCRKCSRLSN